MATKHWQRLLDGDFVADLGHTILMCEPYQNRAPCAGAVLGKTAWVREERDLPEIGDDFAYFGDVDIGGQPGGDRREKKRAGRDVDDMKITAA